MSRPLHITLKCLLAGVAGVLVLAALLVAVFGVVVTRVPEYRVELQDWINERSGLVVEFRSLRARLTFHGPELTFNDAVVRTPDRTRVLATATRGSVGFDLWRAVRDGRLRAGRFALESPQLGLIRTREGRIQLVGQSSLPERPHATVALEELPTGRFEVENAVVSFRDEITGRGPWSVSGVDFDLTRTDEALRLRGEASLPSGLGRKLYFTATADGPLEQYETLASTFAVEGEELDLAGWADVLPDAWPAPETGTGAVRVSGALLGPALTQVAIKVDLHDFAAAPSWSIPLPKAAPLEQPPSAAASEEAQAEAIEQAPTALAVAHGELASLPQLVSYDRVAFDFQAQRAADEWIATLKGVDVARKDVGWRASDIHARWRRGADGSFTASGAADHVALEAVWPMLALLPESERLAHVRALNARGALERIEASIERRPDRQLQYAVKAQVSDVGFDPVAKAPGLSGLSGAVEATHEAGRWRLAPHAVGFALPRWFREPMSAELLSGAVDWRAEASGWTVNGADLRLRNDDGRATARFTASIPREGSPVLDIEARAEDLNVGATTRYIPVGRLGAKTVEWFEQAFIAGKAPAAEFTYKGPTRAFPFRRGEGEFLVRANVENAVFSYQPGWTPATDVAAEVEFRNQGMRIRASAATIGELRVDAATAEIKDLKETVLSIAASARGDVANGLAFLKQSPLGPKLGEQFARLNGAGDMSANVRLYLPIKQIANRDIEVRTRMKHASAWLEGLNAPVRNLSGELTVRNTLLAAADLHGQWLGGPVRVVIEPEGRAASVLTASGRASAERMRAAVSLPAAIKLDGAADWRVSTRLAVKEAGQAVSQVVSIESDTETLAVDLPTPLGKPAAERRDLQVALEFDEAGRLLVRGAYGEVRSLLRFARAGKSWSLERGGVRADGVAPSLPAHEGLRIEGSVDRFVLDDWLALRGSGGGQGRPLSEILHAANVRVRDFQAFGFAWPDVRGVLQAAEFGWRVDVSGANAEGQILIPENLTGAQPLRATLERLVLNRAPSARARPDDPPADPRKLPALQVHVGDLRVGTRTIGAVDLKASRAPQGLSFDSAQASSPALRAEARGHWFVTTDGQHSALNARIVSEDVAGALRALNYTPILEAKRGEVRADVTWPGGFSGNILAHASGAISVEAEAGQLVNVQPGAGRVLGLFSIAALPRRLALDFSDLTEKGLAFDMVRGDFELRDGDAHTTNLLLSGPAAEVGIAGRTGLRTRDYDQTAVVTGKLGASLPVAGALAGGPAVGAALLLFSQVFKEPLKGITRGYYRITGPWETPTVERIDAPQAKAAVTGDE
jgi:uncharacterized protein (TIGR02099 family)